MNKRYHVTIGSNNNIKVMSEEAMDIFNFKYEKNERSIWVNERFETEYIIQFKDFNKTNKPIEKFIKRNGLKIKDII